MDITVNADGQGCYIITCPEEMAWDVRDDLANALFRCCTDQQLGRVILDMKAVKFISSAGLGGIFTLRKHVIDRGGELVIARPAPVVMRLFKTVNIDQLIRVADSIEQARTDNCAA